MAIRPGSCESDVESACETDSITVCVPGMAALIGPVGATGATGPVGATGPPGTGTQSMGGFAPTYINEDETFIVPENKQVLFAVPIVSDGLIAVDGLLIEVS